ncbi:AAA family ATPase [Leifsonia sp. EB34]|uniref:AAA family ATPase n=1 Tax=Leifsonia sp. EB34 TaxID=3156303 RepID=UPI0035125261
MIAAASYADALMTRYIIENGIIRDDLLTRDQLKQWADGLDPLTGQRRGRDLESPVADLILDATINAPKSFSIAAMLDPDLAAAYEDLQDRLRDRIIKLWQAELNARRGKGGAIREDLVRIEVVELRHERSRSLDPHKHRHLWLNVKVQGADGKWSNIDTRVALRFQNVINAEGDLATRTDPAWIRALAAKGFTLDKDGEITQLQHLVRPLSKRSAQIEANKVARTGWWKERHPGQEPSHDVLNQIDRWAWAAGRPNKPSDLHEDDWAQLIREELAAADPALPRERSPIDAPSVSIGDLDIELLAARAVVDADARSTGTGGRFSILDVRAGAIRAIAATGVVATRADLESVETAVVATAQRTHTVTLLSDANIPGHIKSLMATKTATLKAVLAHRIEALSATGTTMDPDEVRAIAGVVEPERTLDDGQVDGATAIAGTSRTVTVSGAAGTGKTTMLKVANAALRRHGRNMIIVAPTKKASDVAGRETRSAASSLHQLLFDYGWRWTTAETGATTWTCLNAGDFDTLTGGTYAGPRMRIRPGDRIVVDEAGMLDLESASALIDVLNRTGAGAALVGDERQALPVGHSGAMALFWRYAADQVELTTIHRYKDPMWADLSLRLRDPRDNEVAAGVADDLVDTRHVVLADGDAAAREAMIDGWFEAHQSGKSIALVTATHTEAQSVSEGIQARRIAIRAIKTNTCVVGQAGQVIFVGDVVQTRRNDGSADVQNRQSWIVKKVTPDKVVLASTTDSSDLRNVSHSYAGSHLHLGYASTVYGVQGETTDLSIVGPGVDAAGLYVGLTRGKVDNSVIVVAASEASAKSQLIEMMQRGAIEETLEASRAAARVELSRAAQRTTGSVVGAGRQSVEASRSL